MAPKFRRGANCVTSHNASSASIDRNSSGTTLLATAAAAEANRHIDSQAMLYIVCTLLFYSLGIVIGIVLYLKDERQDREENRMFDEFVSIKSRHVQNDRRIKVQAVTQRLEELEKFRFHGCQKSLASYNSHHGSVITIMSSNPGATSPKRVYPAIPEQDSQSPGDDVTEGASFNCPTVDTYDETQDPFPNRRLSQVVAQILESDFENSEEYLQEISHNSDDCSYAESDIVETDFIDYKEEPKNKELFRDVSKEYRPIPLADKAKHTLIANDTGSSFDSLVRPFLSDKNHVIGTHAITLSATNIHAATRDHLLAADMANNCLSKSQNELERVRLQLPDGKPFKWSVTSV